KHCDSGSPCSAHQSPVAWKAGIKSGLHRVQTLSGTPCEPHRSSYDPGTAPAGACSDPLASEAGATSPDAGVEELSEDRFPWSAHPTAAIRHAAAAHPIQLTLTIPPQSACAQARAARWGRLDSRASSPFMFHRRFDRLSLSRFLKRADGTQPEAGNETHSGSELDGPGNVRDLGRDGRNEEMGRLHVTEVKLPGR